MLQLRRVVRGERASEVLKWFGYDDDELAQGIQRALDEGVDASRIEASEAPGLLEDYRTRLAQYTCLD